MPDFNAQNTRRRTRYEMEMELLLLKRRLEEERAERERLDGLKRSLDNIKGIKIKFNI